MSHASLLPCDALLDNNDDHVELLVCDNLTMPCYDKTLNMFCAICLQYSPFNGTKMLNNCSFQCLVRNNVNMLANEIAPIALSNFGDFAYVHDKHVHVFTPHIHHIYYDALLNANGDVQNKWNIMMDDVFIYHAHMLFTVPIVCVGTIMPMSTSIEHE
jgi:hypothetical protein